MKFAIENIVTKRAEREDSGAQSAPDIVEIEVSEESGQLEEHYWINLSKFYGGVSLIVAEESIIEALCRMDEDDIEHIQGVAIEKYKGESYELLEQTIDYSAFLQGYHLAAYLMEALGKETGSLTIPELPSD